MSLSQIINAQEIYFNVFSSFIVLFVFFAAIILSFTMIWLLNNDILIFQLLQLLNWQQHIDTKP